MGKLTVGKTNTLQGIFRIFMNLFINAVAFVIDMTNSSINPMFKLNYKRDRFN